MLKNYAHYEHFMQGYRMRGGLCNALSVINGNAKVYQIFTAPEIYEFYVVIASICKRLMKSTLSYLKDIYQSYLNYHGQEQIKP